MPVDAQTVCLILFAILVTLPGIYGLHLYVLMWLVHRRRRDVRAQQAETIRRYRAQRSDDDWPTVTTQLPLYNEIAVAERIIRAVAALDYPAGRHEIQVLDDSTDETRAIVDRVAAELRARGVDIHVVRRPEREHFKAGALAYGLRQARGQYIAIFDADFVPDRGFLRRLIPLIDSDPQAACVQGRWGHLNRDENWLTRAMSLGMDGHFGVEQGARAWNGLLLNFNGTAGIWRRAAIDDPRVGGWSGDTITEDLDLSYRAQLAGWRILYNETEVAPAEIPSDVAALKQQQRRWATGSIQTARKMLPAVWRSPLSLGQKLEATVHLTQYAVNLFMLLMALFGRPLLAMVPEQRYQAYLASSWVLILIAAAGPSLAYVYARWSLDRRVVGPWQILQLMLMGFGLSLNNALAVLRGLWQRGGTFVRTPKTGGVAAVRRAVGYVVPAGRLWLGEIVLGLVCLFQWAWFLRADHYVGGTFLLVYGLGLCTIGIQGRFGRRAARLEPAQERVLATRHAQRRTRPRRPTREVARVVPAAIREPAGRS